MGTGSEAASVSIDSEAEVTRLAVVTERRRQGYARQLLAHCHSVAKAHGIGAVVLWSRPNQVEAHQLYLSLGYERLPDRDSHDEGGEQIVFGLLLDDRPIAAVGPRA